MRSHVYSTFKAAKVEMPLMCRSIGISDNAQSLIFESLGTKQGSNPCSGTTIISILEIDLFFMFLILFLLACESREVLTC